MIPYRVDWVQGRFSLPSVCQFFSKSSLSRSSETIPRLAGSLALDFVAFARASGADGFPCEGSAEIRPTIQAALRSRGQCWSRLVRPNEKAAYQDEMRI